MAATDFLYPRFGIEKGGSALSAGQTVKIDTGNLVSASQASVGVTPTVLVADFPFGVVAENIPAGQQGRVQLEGVANCIALGAITAGNIVGPSTTAGKITTYTAANPSLGQALTAAANASDPVLVRLAISKNA